MGAQSNQDQVLQAKDDEIAELKNLLIQAKADQEAVLEKNKQQLDAIKKEMVEIDE